MALSPPPLPNTPSLPVTPTDSSKLFNKILRSAPHQIVLRIIRRDAKLSSHGKEASPRPIRQTSRHTKQQNIFCCRPKLLSCLISFASGAFVSGNDRPPPHSTPIPPTTATTISAVGRGGKSPCPPFPPPPLQKRPHNNDRPTAASVLPYLFVPSLPPQLFQPLTLSPPYPFRGDRPPSPPLSPPRPTINRAGSLITTPR